MKIFPIFPKFISYISHSPSVFWITLCIVSVIMQCQEKPDYQDEFQERILLQLMLEPAPDVVASCSGYFQSQSTCLSQSTGLRIPTTPEGLAGVNYFTLSGGQQTTESSLGGICSQILSTAFYQRFTPKSQECYFQCQRDTWNGIASRGECNQPGANLLTSKLETDRAILCLRNCGQVNDTSEFF